MSERTNIPPTGGAGDGARRSGNRSLPSRPREFSALLAEGVRCLKAGDAAGALHWLEMAREVRPGDPASLLHLIDARALAGDHDGAEEAFYEALHREADPAEAYVRIAASLLARGLKDRAAWCCAEALRLDAASAGLRGVRPRLAGLLVALGQQERAREMYLRVLREHPGDETALVDLASLLVKMGRLHEAEEKLRRVVELNPAHAAAHARLGELAEGRGCIRDAAAAYRLAYRHDPSLPGVRRMLARTLLMLGDKAAAADLLRADAEAARGSAGTMSNDAIRELWGLLLDAGLAREALVLCRERAEHQPASAEAWHRLSVCFFELGNRRAGIESARKALRLHPRHAAAMHNLALACIEENQFRRALAYLTQASRADPEDRRLRRLRTMLRVQRIMAWLRALGRGR